MGEVSVLILPHQLYAKRYLNKKETHVLWEHPHYFTGYRYNKKKLMLHRAGLQYYRDYLEASGYDVVYVGYDEALPVLSAGRSYVAFDPVDRIRLPRRCGIRESPNFLLGRGQYAAFRERTDKFLFHVFYKWGKKEIDLIPEVTSQDKQNRQRAPAGTVYPPLPSNRADRRYVDAAATWVDAHFPENYGHTADFSYPISHRTARGFLRAFLEERLACFGPYQDFIDVEERVGFHSFLAASINVGLLQPAEIVAELRRVQDQVPVASFEGYVRQLFWREYQRYTYIYCRFRGRTFFGNRRRLTKKWYDGTLGVPPVDDLIRSGFDTGYMHHIGRLMVVGNYMNLSGIAPSQGLRWFMEFSCDSYLWVMHQNVYDMVFFVTGGETMRRPYISSSQYVLRMSNYARGPWCAAWDTLFRDFVYAHRKKLEPFRFALPFLKRLSTRPRPKSQT